MNTVANEKRKSVSLAYIQKLDDSHGSLDGIVPHGYG